MFEEFRNSELKLKWDLMESLSEMTLKELFCQRSPGCEARKMRKQENKRKT